MNGNRAKLVFAAVVLATQSGYDSCSGDILHDSGFDMWCGEELCSWKVERGAVGQVPTWHELDPGVDLLGDDVLLTQRSDVDAAVAPCVRFELVADVEETATVTVEMDLFADGAVDFERQLPTAAWAPLVYLVDMPARYQGILFRLHKTGRGRAVLAQIRARSADAAECAGAAAVEQPPVPLGGDCTSTDPDQAFLPDDGLCAGQECSVTRPAAYLPYACGECETDGDCAGDLCGVHARVASFLDPYRACVAAGTRSLGELCFAGAECATGICCEGICSGCCAPQGCGGGRTCGREIGEAGLLPPWQCDAGQRRGLAGEPCLVDDDCASRACGGGAELRVCPADGRLCRQDPDCPPDPFGDAQGATFGTCLLLGTAGGTCR